MKLCRVCSLSFCVNTRLCPISLRCSLWPINTKLSGLRISSTNGTAGNTKCGDQDKTCFVMKDETNGKRTVEYDLKRALHINGVSTKKVKFSYPVDSTRALQQSSTSAPARPRLTGRALQLPDVRHRGAVVGQQPVPKRVRSGIVPRGYTTNFKTLKKALCSTFFAAISDDTSIVLRYAPCSLTVAGLGPRASRSRS